MTSIETYKQNFTDALLAKNMDNGLAVIEEALANNISPDETLLKIVSPAMAHVGQLQASRVVTLSEVYMISRIGDKAIENLLPLMPVVPKPAGSVVIGTVHGDYHGLGRKIVSSFLRAAGYEVHDLGISVPASRFVNAAVEHEASVICVSALLLHTARRVRNIRDLLDGRKLSGQIKLLVGGAALNFDRRLYREIGADATATNAAEAAVVVKQLMRVVG